MNLLNNFIIRKLGLRPYQEILLAMQNFTHSRITDSLDEIWLVEHPQVFTQGQTGSNEHILNPGIIPVVQSDRGGQITFHGPGQQIMYVLIDLHRRHLNIKNLLYFLEQMILDTLAHFNIHACTRLNAPGIYVGKDKICSIGLRISKGCSFHGLALNINMDLAPFLRINPCGCIGLRMTQMSNFIPDITLNKVEPILISKCLMQFNNKY